MYLIGLNDQYLEFDDVEKLISLFQIVENQNYILAGVKRMSINPDEKELEITILFLCHALLNNDVATVNRVLCVFQSLQDEWGICWREMNV